MTLVDSSKVDPPVASVSRFSSYGPKGDGRIEA
jgi:hypothetical protein